MKDDYDEYEKTTLISYVSKFENLEHYKGGSVKFCNDAPCLVKGKGPIKLIDEIRCDNAYWVEGLNYFF